tara:strand:- start:15 stop:272 length:258 start_codon:yes stop_codon:yes gene_type:complete
LHLQLFIPFFLYQLLPFRNQSTIYLSVVVEDSSLENGNNGDGVEFAVALEVVVFLLEEEDDDAFEDEEEALGVFPHQALHKGILL